MAQLVHEIPSTGRLARLATWLGRSFVDERDRWALWLPVAGGVGIGIYFALPVEPPVWAGASAILASLVLCVALRRRPVALLAAAMLLAASAGFGGALLRTSLVAAPALTRELAPVDVVGRVVEVEALPHGQRVTLDHLVIERLPPAATPARVRVRIARGAEEVRPGDRLALLAGLMPPSPPLLPGGYDFQRRAFFERIGGNGFSYGAPRGIDPAAGADRGPDIRLWFADLRRRVTARVLAVLPGPSGAVAAALMTGSQTAIPEDVIVAMRDSGLAHLLSISGLHVGLVAGIVFVGLRGALALVPRLALRYPIKKWTAVVALFAALFYMLLAGAPVPTQRAFLMTGLVLVAVLVDRNPFSMRTVAWAAAGILLLAPETLTGPSFQMSFAAVVALIAAYETSRDWRRRRRGDAGWPRWLARYAGGLAFTSLVAGAATTPYAVFHFGRMANFGVVANMAAVPMTGLWIMPFAVLTFLLMPFGLEAVALVPMGWGVDGVIWVARVVAGWPGAAAMLPVMPLWGLILVTLGGLWLAFWNRPWRLLGAAPMAAGTLSLLLTVPPDILVAGDARLVAVRDADGGMLLSTTRAERFTADAWLRGAGEEDGAAWPSTGVSADGWLACDGLGCIYRPEGGHIVALVRAAGALAEDCAVADVVVSLVPVRRDCPSAEIVVDRFDLWRDGAHALWLEPDAVKVMSVGETRGVRPWVIRPAAD